MLKLWNSKLSFYIVGLLVSIIKSIHIVSVQSKRHLTLPIEKNELPIFDILHPTTLLMRRKNKVLPSMTNYIRFADFNLTSHSKTTKISIDRIITVVLQNCNNYRARIKQIVIKQQDNFHLPKCPFFVYKFSASGMNVVSSNQVRVPIYTG